MYYLIKIVLNLMCKHARSEILCVYNNNLYDILLISLIKQVYFHGMGLKNAIRCMLYSPKNKLQHIKDCSVLIVF